MLENSKVGQTVKIDEIEDRWLLSAFSPNVIPCTVTEFFIIQIYLAAVPGMTRRVRMRRDRKTGEVRYEYTKKVPGKRKGVRSESTTYISKEEFERFVRVEADANCEPLYKIRYVFPFSGFDFEVDVFCNRDLIIMECEKETPEEMVATPHFIDPLIVRMINDDKALSNRALAEKGRVR